MHYNLNIIDCIITAILAMSVPLLVNIYLTRPLFSTNDRQVVIFGGVLWMGYVLVSQTLSAEVLGVPWLDARYHAFKAMELVRLMDRGEWTAVWDLYRAGNRAYHMYVAFILSVGGSMYAATAINAWLAFWGGLVLAYYFSTVGPFPRNRRIWLYLTIFFPSVIFWCTTNLKEALMYWSICNIFSLAFISNRKQLLSKVPIVVIAVLIGVQLRPHVVTGWLMALAVVNLFQAQRRAAAVIIIVCLPIVAISVSRLTGVDFSTESLVDMVETRAELLGQPKSVILQFHYMAGKPIFFVSGFISAFFRPFPWQINSLRVLVQVMETWGLTFLILAIWMRASKVEWQAAVKHPAIRVAFLASMWLCLLLTYYPNQGLVVRQRVQMIPGLMALAVLPVLMHQAVLLKREYQRRILNSSPQAIRQRDGTSRYEPG